MDIKDRIEGCMFGLAIGDALGAPVEFLANELIRSKIGPEGITDFISWNKFERGTYTDDTQMSIETAEALISTFEENGEVTIDKLTEKTYVNFINWLEIQSDDYYNRGPGITCIRALRTGRMGTVEKPINNSKGCGGVMRTAPIGLVSSPEFAFNAAERNAAITHGHPSGYLSAGCLSELIAYIVRGDKLIDAVNKSLESLKLRKQSLETVKALEQAIRLYMDDDDMDDSYIIAEIGGGWVGEEALAIAVFCALKYQDDFNRGILAAVNHSGDSDSTGSITGAILGAYLGVKSIPEKWKKEIEDSEKLKNISERLFRIKESTIKIF